MTTVVTFLSILYPRFFIVHIFFAFILFWFFYEGILRLILHAAYGSEYKNSFLLYSLIDHPIYGYALRKRFSAKKANFLIFDKYLFFAGVPRILDLGKNIEVRNNFNVNLLGFRGKEFLPDKKSARLRIFCSGGSTTAGSYLDDDVTWPAALERFLKKQGYDAEVINAGVFGWFSYQEFLRFRDEIVRYWPDVVLLHQGWNEEFEYSSLSLGKKWKPRVARNVRETNNVYSSPSRFLSSARFISKYLTIQAAMKQFVFTPKMRFTNPERWKAFSRSDYVLAWFDVLMDTARLAKESGTLLYAVDYPGLVDMADSSTNRDTYVQNSRLTPLYADYQAIAKKRISRTLETASEIIPMLKAEESLLDYQGGDRLKLFSDEIHMTREGNAVFAKYLGEKLIADPSFQKRYREAGSGKKESNVVMDGERIRRARKTLEDDSPYLARFIRGKIAELERGAAKAGGEIPEVPEDRYTTF